MMGRAITQAAFHSGIPDSFPVLSPSDFSLRILFHLTTILPVFHTHSCAYHIIWSSQLRAKLNNTIYNDKEMNQGFC
jgi:hypothetical protein